MVREVPIYKVVEREVAKANKKHSADIGTVVIAWNTLQRILGDFFVVIVKSDYPDRIYTAWHSIQSDRGQRRMVSAIIAQHFPKNEKRREAILWALDQIDRLEGRRNEIVHSPYSYRFDNNAIVPFAYHLTGNRSAGGINKAMEKEETNFKKLCAVFVKDASSLSGYIRKLKYHFVDQPQVHMRPEFPDKPKLQGGAKNDQNRKIQADRSHAKRQRLGIPPRK